MKYRNAKKKNGFYLQSLNYKKIESTVSNSTFNFTIIQTFIKIEAELLEPEKPLDFVN